MVYVFTFLKLCAATVISLLVTSLIYLVGHMIRHVLRGEATPLVAVIERETTGVGVITMFGTLFMMPIILLFALPTALFLEHQKWLNLWHWLAAASVVPLIFTMIGMAIADDRVKFAIGALLALSFALGTAGIYWTIWVRPRLS